MPKGTHYTSEFKREAVKLAQSSDRPTSQRAAELGIKANTLYNWVSTAMKDKITPTTSTASKSKHSYQELESEIKWLNKELKRAEMEREILKKAAIYFANHAR